MKKNINTLNIAVLPMMGKHLPCLAKDSFPNKSIMIYLKYENHLHSALAMQNSRHSISLLVGLTVRS
jgi:hypothetical protein